MLLNLFMSRWFFIFHIHVDNPITIVLAFTVGAIVTGDDDVEEQKMSHTPALIYEVKISPHLL